MLATEKQMDGWVGPDSLHLGKQSCQSATGKVRSNLLHAAGLEGCSVTMVLPREEMKTHPQTGSYLPEMFRKQVPLSFPVSLPLSQQSLQHCS